MMRGKEKRGRAKFACLSYLKQSQNVVRQSDSRDTSPKISASFVWTFSWFRGPSDDVAET